ncbi:protein lin [Pontoporia blainvillei]|uniref:Protein lin-28 homolog A n=1 Tax=Pontoporia blainvillei TaxID=48723 RepID=A0ABX0S918_PONBL|nr:protein lin [Pontoporia blainvillei]
MRKSVTYPLKLKEEMKLIVLPSFRNPTDVLLSACRRPGAQGCTGSADYHELCVRPAVCRWPEEVQKDAARATEEPQLLCGAGICKWFNVRVGFGFLSMTARAGVALKPPVDVFVHQSKGHMEGLRSLKEGEATEFTFKKSAKGLESIRVTGPGGVSCIGSERRPKGKNMQKCRSKGDNCHDCGGLGHHAKECKRPPQPKECHFCQSINHMVASCPPKAQQAPRESQPTFGRREKRSIALPRSQRPRIEPQWVGAIRS